MSVIEWDSKLALGIGKIDEQHRKLIQMTQELEEAVSDHYAGEVIEDIVTNLFNYAQVHFETEEELFHRFLYPEKEMHELEHRRFIAKTFEFKEKLDARHPRLYLELLNFLAGWILSHIEVTDRRYTGFMSRHGVT